MTTSTKVSACDTATLNLVSRGSLALRGLSLLLLCALVGVLTLRAGAFGLEGAQSLMASLRAENDVRILLLLALIYATVLAMPFVPGMELGVLLMVALGPRGVVLVYAASLLGLSVSYAAGRWLPLHWTPARRLNVDPAKARLDTTSQLQSLVSGHCLARRLPTRLMARLATHRYLAFAVSLNLPGNMVVGGGGGIALLCGLSGLYGYWRFLFTVAVAISPLPIATLMSSWGLGAGAA